MLFTVKNTVLGYSWDNYGLIQAFTQDYPQLIARSLRCWDLRLPGF